MVPQLLTLLRSRPRVRSRARMFLSPNCPAVENLEERTLLSAATLSILNGNFTGSYAGQITVNNNGSITKSAVTSTALSMAINNGAITFTTPVGDGTGTVTVGRAIPAPSKRRIKAPRCRLRSLATSRTSTPIRRTRPVTGASRSTSAAALRRRAAEAGQPALPRS